MRTSNKILSGLILTAILLFAGLFISVRVKYANGAIVKTKRINDWSDVHTIKEPIKSVSISRLGEVMIIPSDSARLEIWKHNGEQVKWRLQDGVLIIESDTTQTNNRNRDHVVYGHIELFLPNVDSIYALKSKIEVKNIADSGVLKPAYNFQLEETELTIESHRRNNNRATFYDKIRVNAGKGSAVRFRGALHINEFQARLTDTELEDEWTFFDKLTIQTDSTSTIKLKGHNLRKATITSTE